MSLSNRYVGIDYSGAETAEKSLKGPGKYWSRRALAGWRVEQLSGGVPAIVGIDYASSFPLAYFERHKLTLDWPAFLNEFQRHCPSDEPNTYVDFVRNRMVGCWDKVTGEPSWLRLTEQWTVSARSVFQFEVQGAVAKATYAGLPWLRYLREELNGKVHFWPFDGWDVPHGRSVMAEVYPSLWTKRFPRQDRDGDQHAAYSVAAWLRRTDVNGSLAQFFHPALDQRERKIAEIEGWILGVV